MPDWLAGQPCLWRIALKDSGSTGWVMLMSGGCTASSAEEHQGAWVLLAP